MVDGRRSGWSGIAPASIDGPRCAPSGARLLTSSLSIFTHFSLLLGLDAIELIMKPSCNRLSSLGHIVIGFQ